VPGSVSRTWKRDQRDALKRMNGTAAARVRFTRLFEGVRCQDDREGIYPCFSASLLDILTPKALVLEGCARRFSRRPPPPALLSAGGPPSRAAPSGSRPSPSGDDIPSSRAPPARASCCPREAGEAGSASREGASLPNALTERLQGMRSRCRANKSIRTGIKAVAIGCGTL